MGEIPTTQAPTVEVTGAPITEPPPNNTQWIRKVGLLVVAGDRALDLSELRVRFEVQAADVESPNNAAIRVYNLAEDTSRAVQKEYDAVVLQAGYENGVYGVIFQGSIKQFRRGRESNTDTYLDILAADGDLGYNAVINTTLAARSSTADRVQTLAKAMGLDLQSTTAEAMKATGGILPRGKVLFGMGRAFLRRQADTLGMTWSIQGGQVQMIPLDGYLPGEAVVLNAASGLIGMPEQTQEGLKATCLINPNLRIGGLVKINNADINQIIQQNPRAAPIPHDTFKGMQFFASIADDGLYRLFVVEHIGDSRGQAWYSNLVMLRIDESSLTVNAKN